MIKNRTTIRKNINGKETILSSVSKQALRQPKGKKAVTNLNSILKNRDITLLTKACIVKAVVFSVVMYGCEKWTIKKGCVWKNRCF